MTKGAPFAQTPHVNLLLRNQATVREIVSELLTQLTLSLRKWNYSQKHSGGKGIVKGLVPPGWKYSLSYQEMGRMWGQNTRHYWRLSGLLALLLVPLHERALNKPILLTPIVKF